MTKGKRANGEGTICQRQDGTWMAAVSLGRKPDGKVNRKCFYGKTRKEVQQKMVACLNDSQRGIITISTKQTVGDFMEFWLEDVARPRIRETTYRSYEQITRNHIKPGIGRVQLNKLTPQQVQQFLKVVHDKGINCEPVRRVLRAALNQALDWDLIARNPAKVKGIPKRDTKQGTYLDEDQARKLLEGCRNHKHGPLFLVLTMLGLRIGEALALEWSDISWAESKARVTKQLQIQKGEVKLVSPKSRQSNRTLLLAPAVLDALRRAETLRRKYREGAGSRWIETDFVFTSRIGTALDAKNVRDDFKDLLHDLELPDIRLHDLRHTCATMHLAAGTQARVISELLGHSQVSFTLSTYAHAMESLHEEAAKQLQNRLLPGFADPQPKSVAKRVPHQ